MAGERIFNCRGGKTGATQVDMVTHGRIIPGTVAHVNQGTAAKTGSQETVIGYRSLDVDVFGIDPIYHLVSATHSAAIVGARFARVIPSTVIAQDPGAAGALGIAETVITRKGLDVELFGLDFAVLAAKIGVAKQNLALAAIGAAGAAKTITVGAVYFHTWLGEIPIPDRDTGGMLQTFGIRGSCEWADNTAFTDLITGDGDTELIALLGATAANFIFQTTGSDGTAEKITCKNVFFHTFLDAVAINAADAGSRLPASGIRGSCEWGAEDTFATMIAAAADT